jgi:hypothetical protein
MNLRTICASQMKHLPVIVERRWLTANNVSRESNFANTPRFMMLFSQLAGGGGGEAHKLFYHI